MLQPGADQRHAEVQSDQRSCEEDEVLLGPKVAEMRWLKVCRFISMARKYTLGVIVTLQHFSLHRPCCAAARGRPGRLSPPAFARPLSWR